MFKNSSLNLNCSNNKNFNEQAQINSVNIQKEFFVLLHLRMQQIVYPSFPFKIKEEHNAEIIFDEVRKKWVRLTPEEWVRQNFIQYLLQVKKYPSSIIAIEKEIKLGDLKKRCDIVVYKNDKPWMIVECKEQAVLLNDATIQQVLRYNISLDVTILVITNGDTTHAVELKTTGMQVLDFLPAWNE